MQRLVRRGLETALHEGDLVQFDERAAPGVDTSLDVLPRSRREIQGEVLVGVRGAEHPAGDVHLFYRLPSRSIEDVDREQPVVVGGVVVHEQPEGRAVATRGQVTRSVPNPLNVVHPQVRAVLEVADLRGRRTPPVAVRHTYLVERAALGLVHPTGQVGRVGPEDLDEPREHPLL